MGKSTPPTDFRIHVDESCLTDSTDLEMPNQRTTSNQTDVHHDSVDELAQEQTPATQKTDKAEEIHDGGHKIPEDHRERLDERIEAQIQEAARRVVASIERDNYECHEDSILSAQTDESCDQDGIDLTYDGTELTYDGTEGTFESEDDHHSGDEHTEATFEPESELDAKLEQALTAWEPDNEHHSEIDQGDSSSHHDGDVDDDVFSRDSGHSQRSSLNSIHDLISSDEACTQKNLTSPAVGEEAATSHPVAEPVSRIPSGASYAPQDESNLHTPSKVLHRPPFRTPSSVRAIQMSSPTPSIFSSPRSTKRHLPTVSRIGTPTSQYSPSKRTPTRFKAKKEQPLVLLHVTVMPLQWPYAHIMPSRELPETLHHVKESWRLLQDRLADTVLERGILLSHPQDSYEVLEERLLEALELPVRPRARILKCGHYMGPLDSDTPSSDEETGDSYFRRESGTDRKWCDICRKDVRIEDGGEGSGKRRFNLKIYASNGLMRAGAWAAAWREMERVDVEIEPWVELGLRAELEHLASAAPLEALTEEHDGFVDEEEMVEQVQERSIEDEQKIEEAEQRRAEQEEEDLKRKFEEEEMAHKMMEEEEMHRKMQEEEMAQKMMEEEELHRKMQEEEVAQKMMEEEEMHRKMQEEDIRRKIMEEERMREIYGHEAPPMERPRRSRRSSFRQTVDPDSLAELLLAAFKVLMRDKRNIVIGVLSILVLLLALQPRSTIMEQPPAVMRDFVPEIVREVPREFATTVTQSVTSAEETEPKMPSKVAEFASTVTQSVTSAVEMVPHIPSKVAELVKEVASEAPVLQISPTEDEEVLPEPESAGPELPVVEVSGERPRDESPAQEAQEVVLPQLDKDTAENISMPELEEKATSPITDESTPGAPDEGSVEASEIAEAASE